MGSDRRAFLQFAGLAPAAAATAGLASTGTPTPAPGGLPTRSSFVACVGEVFQFETGPFESKPAKLALVAPIEQGGGKVESEREFRLEFEPQTPGTLAQETYVVNHASLGRFALFVSPNDAEGRVVEAVFNSP